MAKFNSQMPSEHYDQRDAAAIMSSNIPQGLLSDGMRFDSAEAASIYFARELDYVKSKTYDKKYPEFNALRLFPISHEVNEGAESITYYSYEKTGFAKIISNYANDLPRADVKGKPFTSPVKSIGDSYGYSMQDMRASRMAGKSLDTRRGEAARYQIERLINKIAWVGDAETGLVGVLSTGNNVPVYTLANSTAVPASVAWENKTAEEIVADIIGMLEFQATSTMSVEKADTLVLPPSIVLKLSKKIISGTNVTLYSFLKQNAPYIKNWEEAAELEANAGETNPFGQTVILLYSKDPEKFTVEIPLDFYQYAAQPKGLEVEIPCEARVAGAVIYYPMSMVIALGA